MLREITSKDFYVYVSFNDYYEFSGLKATKYHYKS